MEENNLNIIIGITEIIFFVTLSILAVYLIISMKKFLSSISRIENEVVEITDQISPVIADMKFITDDIKEIVDRSRIQFSKLEEITEGIAEKGEAVVKTLDTIQNLSSGYINNSLNFLSSVSTGFKTFKQKLKNNFPLRIKNVNNLS